jgi:hypothetical protein
MTSWAGPRLHCVQSLYCKVSEQVLFGRICRQQEFPVRTSRGVLKRMQSVFASTRNRIQRPISLSPNSHHIPPPLQGSLLCLKSCTLQRWQPSASAPRTSQDVPHSTSCPTPLVHLSEASRCPGGAADNAFRATSPPIIANTQKCNLGRSSVFCLSSRNSECTSLNTLLRKYFFHTTSLVNASAAWKPMPRLLQNIPIYSESPTIRRSYWGVRFCSTLASRAVQNATSTSSS